MTRFRDYQTSLAAFEREVWVRCPRCQQATLSRCLDQGLTWRIACPHCGYIQSAFRDAQRQRSQPWWTQGWWGEARKFGGAVDPLFGLPLWLQVPCCGQVLWVYNQAHLEFLEHYVRSTLRERQGSKGNHHSMAVRLPRWIKQAQHREAVLKGLQQLKERLEG
ncbi:hypothetical protein BST81_01995 [Leptolyngbya sp. 'hensonii']|uniref:hypothetical protein n=1 Tax=Leptolyngbya sp. 'hensonii' TaxID=1922337 RepID=UPI00094F5EB9|nr:hypothetical protein [Leptolyngbya sp. 'hensonii']OLP20034.1 hypothetical protein BST81_01995 [Leptolyngbya sp. 'hensonii']